MSHLWPAGVSPFDTKLVDFGRLLIFWYEKVLWAQYVYFLCRPSVSHFSKKPSFLFVGSGRNYNYLPPVILTTWFFSLLWISDCQLIKFLARWYSYFRGVYKLLTGMSCVWRPTPLWKLIRSVFLCLRSQCYRLDHSTWKCQAWPDLTPRKPLWVSHVIGSRSSRA